MPDFLSFSGDFCPSHEDVRDIALRDRLRTLMPAILKPITVVTLTEGKKKIEIELEKIEGSRPTFYIDIEEKVSSDGAGIFRSLTMDEETGYVTDLAFDSFNAPDAYAGNSDTAKEPVSPTVMEMDFTMGVTEERVSEIRQEIESLFS